MWLQPIYSLKVTLEIFIHRNSTGILKIIAKGHQVLLYMNGYWHVTSQDWSKRYSFHSKCYFSFLTRNLKVTGSTISTPKSYDEHPRQVKYGSLPPPPPPRVASLPSAQQNSLTCADSDSLATARQAMQVQIFYTCTGRLSIKENLYSPASERPRNCQRFCVPCALLSAI